MNPVIARARTLLFVPGYAPPRFDKALDSGADAVILDLEDAVSPADKPAARQAVAAWLQAQAPARRDRVLLRINAADAGGEHALDLALLRSLPDAQRPAGVVLPKACDCADLAALAQAAGPRLALLPLIECARGWARAERLAAAAGVCRLVFGHLDFQLDMDMDCGPAQEELLPVRLALVAASRMAGLAAPVDGVTPAVGDDAACREDALRARRLGFGGKLCIHPRQVPVVRDAVAPSAGELDWARRVLQARAAQGQGVFQFEGRMVDAPVMRRAERIAGLQGLPQASAA